MNITLVAILAIKDLSMHFLRLALNIAFNSPQSRQEI